MTDRESPVAGTGAALRVALALLALASCSESRAARRLPDGYRLVQKRGFQALYGPHGRLERVLHDEDGDGVAEAIVLYDGDGVVVMVELDRNGDHLIDYRETRGFSGSTDPGRGGDGGAGGSR